MDFNERARLSVASASKKRRVEEESVKPTVWAFTINPTTKLVTWLETASKMDAMVNSIDPSKSTFGTNSYTVGTRSPKVLTRFRLTPKGDGTYRYTMGSESLALYGGGDFSVVWGELTDWLDSMQSKRNIAIEYVEVGEEDKTKWAPQPAFLTTCKLDIRFVFLGCSLDELLDEHTYPCDDAKLHLRMNVVTAGYLMHKCHFKPLDHDFVRVNEDTYAITHKTVMTKPEFRQSPLVVMDRIECAMMCKLPTSAVIQWHYKIKSPTDTVAQPIPGLGPPGMTSRFSE